jgi:hypothetical protein
MSTLRIICPTDDHLFLFVKKFPGICTVKLSDPDASRVFWLHHARIDGYTAIVLFFNTLIMRGAPAGFTVIELDTLVTPHICLSRLGFAANPNLLPGVIGPPRTQTMTN